MKHPSFASPLPHLLGALGLCAQLVFLSSAQGDVLTYHYDNARSGLNSQETILTPGNVNFNQFGLLHNCMVDGKVDAGPLYVSKVTIPNQGIHNVLYVATENDSLYAFDADTGAQLWKVSVLPAGETPSDDRGCNQITPQIGITSTPVIDRGAGANGTIFLVAMSKDASGNYYQRLHALDLTTGSEMPGKAVEITASFPGNGPGGSGGNVIFDPGQYAERCALLLSNGVIYTAWTSHCDDPPYTGWMIGYDENTLEQTKVINVDPAGEPTSGFLDDGSGNSFWMSGTGPAADAQGNIYAISANGPFDPTLVNGFPANGDYGDSMIKFSPGNGLTVADYFTPYNQQNDANGDVDFGSGGVLLLPDMTDAQGQVQHLAVGAGKDGNLYVVNRDSMGKYNSTSNQIYEELNGALPGGEWATSAYFNGNVYYAPVGGNLLCFTFTNARLSTQPTSRSSTTFSYPGSTPSVSSNGNQNGIVWAYDNSNGPAILHAYDATNVADELYNSTMAPSSRDSFGSGNKFITTMVANGKVYAPTQNSVAIFGPIVSSATSDFVAASGQTISLPLALSGTPTVEPRQGSMSKTFDITVNFNEPVTSLSASLGVQPGQVAAPAGSVHSITYKGTSATIRLTGVNDAQRLSLNLTAIQPGTYSINIPFSVLWADVDGNGVVTSADVTPIRIAYGSAAGTSTYNIRADLNADGVVTSNDLTPVKTNFGKSLP